MNIEYSMNNDNNKPVGGGRRKRGMNEAFILLLHSFSVIYNFKALLNLAQNQNFESEKYSVFIEVNTDTKIFILQNFTTQYTLSEVNFYADFDAVIHFFICLILKELQNIYAFLCLQIYTATVSHQ